MTKNTTLEKLQNDLKTLDKPIDQDKGVIFNFLTIEEWAERYKCTFVRTLGGNLK